jgi:surface protein
MENMFDTCMKLNSLDLSSFDTSNVTKMSWMFLNCQALTSVNVLSFNTSKVTNMIAMFSLCSSLTSLDLSSFDTSNVESMMQMFIHCYGLAELKMKGGLKSGVDVENMFTNAGSKAATTPIFYYKNGDELNYSAVIGTLGDDNTYSGGALPSSWTRQVISE